MASLTLTGDTSGQVTLAAPAVAGTNTLTLPALTGTVLTNKTAGTVLQVVSATLTTSTSSTSTTDVSIGLSASITPSSASSKIFVMYNLQGSTTNSFNATLYRGASTICTNTSSPSLRAVTSSFVPSTAGVSCLVTQSQNFLDSPATTSATTYEVKCNTNAGTFYVNRNDGTSFGSTSTITLMEIAA